MLAKGEETDQQIELLPKENKAQQPYVFYFNKCFMNAGLVEDAGGDLAQVNNQTKVKEDNSMEELNPSSREINLLEKVLNNHDSIVKEGKDDREAVSEETKEKVGARKVEISKASKSRVSIEDNNENLKKNEEDRNMRQNMNQFRDMLEKEIEEMWQLMMKKMEENYSIRKKDQSELESH